ncbi:MAG: copper resistance protein CopC [Deltaproteobacteria bacterium]|nr:copper resistance protein CopC [Deltaproteobacteria bacterium]
MTALTLSTRLRVLLVVLFTLVGGVAVGGEEELRALLLQRPAARSGTVLAPDRLLRRWDPLTVFFAADRGPATPGTEHSPERLIRLDGAPAGAWRWIDARTLQFVPADPWPPLAKITARVEGEVSTLYTVLSPPRQTEPQNGARVETTVDRLTLTFSEPIAPEVLRESLRIELRDETRPDAAPRVLTGRDLSVKAIERASRRDPARVVVRLAEPLPAGVKVAVRMRLTQEDSHEHAPTVLRFSTAPPFRAGSLGCGSASATLTPEGARYTPQQALRCEGSPKVILDFTASLGSLGPVEARNLLRFEPAVRGLEFKPSASRLTITGDFARDTLYTVSVVPTAITDRQGRALDMTGPSTVHMLFPAVVPMAKLLVGEGIVERYGPQRLPIEGQGKSRLDLRIYAADPLDRTLWPFPTEPLSVDEESRPPGPGEEPNFTVDPRYDIAPHMLSARVKGLGSPLYSGLVDVDLGDGDRARGHLDLAPILSAAQGAARPGTYLVGVRAPDQAGPRRYTRVQVTDLSLTAVEEPLAVELLVSSLRTGGVVSGATIRVEAARVDADQKAEWVTVWSGTTDGKGRARWLAPGKAEDDPQLSLRRVVVQKGEDVLVLAASRPPEQYTERGWSKTGGWLGYTVADLAQRAPQASLLAHVFSERPIYRPNEVIHLRGFVRSRDAGLLTRLPEGGALVISGPNNKQWRVPVVMTTTGGFYHRFDEADLPSGDYVARYEHTEGGSIGEARFKVESYRLPEFEVSLHTPPQAALDAPFDVTLTASWYAGGRVAERPVRWRVVETPAAWTPPGAEGFRFSSDGRYGRAGRFEARAATETISLTDAEGGARITLDPSMELSSMPRRYVVEATVTGADDQTVTTTVSVDALPAFTLGVKAPRYLEKTTTLPIELLALGPTGKAVADLDVTVRLIHRQWHSHLQAGDFTEAEARYVSEVVEVPVEERIVRSGAKAVPVSFTLPRAGVYLVELEAQDKLGRAQVVRVDLYAGGEQSVTWEKPSGATFELSLDAETYNPGDTANLVLRSPFREAEALIITEAPDGNRYDRVSVRDGKGVAKVKIEGRHAPRLPVHVVLMRGRGGDAVVAGGDPGKPATLAASVNVEVNPVENQLQVALEAPKQALPGEEVPITVRLKDPSGRPMAGEVTLWLVDAAVLALAPEARLDPLPDLLKAAISRLRLRDTRNLTLGSLPLSVMPGGDSGKGGGVLDRVTVRKDMVPVPYYEPFLAVPKSGVLTVKVKLPDNLTTFRLRAKATAGDARFGVGQGDLAVRLPVVAQAALPRFLRPGDSVEVGLISRVVEGPGGAAQVELSAQGATVTGGAPKAVKLDAKVALREDYTLTVADDARGVVTVTGGVRRSVDGAGDAVRVELPLRDARRDEISRVLATLDDGPLSLPAVTDALPGTARRRVLVTDQAALVRLAIGVTNLLNQPYGNVEQRVSAARALLALRELRELMAWTGAQDRLDRMVLDTLRDLPRAVDNRGLVAFWPGGQGTVALTAWSWRLLDEANRAGLPIDVGLKSSLERALERSLRSDAGVFLDGESWTERTIALSTLAAAGRYDAAYFSELSREARWQDAEGAAETLIAGVRGGQATPEALDALIKTVLDAYVFRLQGGREVYGGLKVGRTDRSPMILPSEARTLARTVQALSLAAPQHDKLAALTEALVSLGQSGGWGQTNADAEAILALAERLGAGRPGQRVVTVQEGATTQRLTFGDAAGSLASVNLGGGAATITRAEGAGLFAWVETRYAPQSPPAQLNEEAQGFAVSRALWRVGPSGPDERLPWTTGGATLSLQVGDVVEDRVTVVTPQARSQVRLIVPLAAGLEPLNPRLATAGPEATPSRSPSIPPDFIDARDDVVIYGWDNLPQGSVELALRARAASPGRTTLPSARAELVYDDAVWGRSAGAWVTVE